MYRCVIPPGQKVTCRIYQTMHFFYFVAFDEHWKTQDTVACRQRMELERKHRDTIGTDAGNKIADGSRANERMAFC